MKEAEKILADLNSVHGAGRVWLAKDVRLSITLPFWETVSGFPRAPVCIIPFRHPREVSQSSILRSAEAWAAYVLSAVNVSAGFHRILLDFDELQSRPVETVTRLYHVLVNIMGVSGLSMPSEQQILDFVDGDMRHFDHRDGDGGGDVAGGAAAAAAAVRARLQSAASERHECLWRSLVDGSALHDGAAAAISQRCGLV